MTLYDDLGVEQGATLDIIKKAWRKKARKAHPDKLHALGIEPAVYAHPDCLVTTFADMLINQARENKLGAKRHGSCGVGINETIHRSSLPELKITMSDLWNRIGSLESKLAQICKKYAQFRTGNSVGTPSMIEAFIKGCWKFADRVHPAGIGQCQDPVFEGAQGLLLDQNNKEFFPHVTRSNTGMMNVRTLCAQAGIDDIEAFYVSRTYLTRHGAGPLPGEDPKMSFEDNTNIAHAFQGTLRFAPLDMGLERRVKADAGSDYKQLVLTHCDQLKPSLKADFYSHGPSHHEVTKA